MSEHYYQISSGFGPSECELAVAKLLDYLSRTYKDIEIIQTTGGYESGTYKSAAFKSGEDLFKFVGTVQWICPSPFRPNHKRKNWFIIVSEYKLSELPPDFDESKIVFQTMRASGSGGQNVNKVETAVRAIYGDIAVVCMDERSQHRNKQIAVERIKLRLLMEQQKVRDSEKKENWSQHSKLVRGNAGVVFEGEKFKLIRE